MVKILSIISILLSIAIGIALIAQKWGKTISEWWRRKKVWKFIVSIIIPAVVSIIVSIATIVYDIMRNTLESINDLDPSFYPIIIIVLAAIVLTAINIYIQFIYWKKDIDETNLKLENQASKFAYDNLYSILKGKNAQLSKSSHENFQRGQLTKEDVPYDIFSQIREICLGFRNTICNITGTSVLRASVSFIYRYSYEGATEEDRNWRWVIGENSKLNLSLPEFVSRGDSLYNYIISNNIPFLIYNDKKEAASKGCYYYYPKDRLYNNSGSILASMFSFHNNEGNCCDGIIMIATYGQKFIDKDSIYNETEFRNLILDKIYPCYKNLLQTELGMLYFTHRDDTASI